MKIEENLRNEATNTRASPLRRSHPESAPSNRQIDLINDLLVLSGFIAVTTFQSQGFHSNSYHDQTTETAVTTFQSQGFHSLGAKRMLRQLL